MRNSRESLSIEKNCFFLSFFLSFIDKFIFSVLLWTATLKQQGPLECSCPPQGLGDESPATSFRLGQVGQSKLKVAAGLEKV
jgi:hypothetical protein